MMDQFNTLVDALQRGGGWGVAVIFGAAVIHLWRELRAKDRRVFDLLDKQNIILAAIERLATKRQELPALEDKDKQ